MAGLLTWRYCELPETTHARPPTARPRANFARQLQADTKWPSRQKRRSNVTVCNGCQAGSERAPPRRARGPRRTPSGALTSLSPAMSAAPTIPPFFFAPHPGLIGDTETRSRPIHPVGQGDPAHGCGHGWSRFGNYRIWQRMIFALRVRFSVLPQVEGPETVL